MHHRRSTATALVALLLPLAATLTSCGFDYPTDRVNTIAAGVNNREGDVKVLGARVVAWSDGQGRLIGSLVYSDKDADQPAQLTDVAGDALTNAEVPDGIEIPPTEGINLASDDVAPVALEGDFTAGDVVTLSLTFSTGESASLDVPVVKPCRQYAEITQPEFSAAASEETDAPTDTATAEADDTYLCDHPTESAQGEE